MIFIYKHRYIFYKYSWNAFLSVEVTINNGKLNYTKINYTYNLLVCIQMYTYVHDFGNTVPEIFFLNSATLNSNELNEPLEYEPNDPQLHHGCIMQYKYHQH